MEQCKAQGHLEKVTERDCSKRLFPMRCLHTCVWSTIYTPESCMGFLQHLICQCLACDARILDM